MLWSLDATLRPESVSRQAIPGSTQNAARRFFGSERGSMTIFTLFIFVVMLMITGMAVDLMRFESRRVALQSTLDRAVLAAADMDQTLAPGAVVQDFFAKAGLAGVTVQSHVEEGDNFRSVAAASALDVQPLFMQLLGIDMLSAPAAGGAKEGMTSVEISLVLDISRSMDSNSRLTNLKTAAKEFVDTVVSNPTGTTTTQDLTHISIVPFSTQVNAGSTLASYMNYSGEHSSSYCVDWRDAEYSEAGLPASGTVRQAGHFDPDSNNLSSSSRWSPVCSTKANHRILPFANDIPALKAFIDDLTTDMYTSIEIGAKWGAVMLDPSFRSAVSAMATDGLVDTDFSDRPLDYGSRDALKVMIVMSDGENTSHWELNDAFRSGLSNIWYDATAKQWSVYDTTAGQYWRKKDDAFHGSPEGSNAKQLSWAEVWALASVDWIANNLMNPMWNSNSKAKTWQASVFKEYGTAEKNTRTSAACKAAKDQGVTIYAIGFETNAAGDAALRDCATSAAHFFNAAGTQISDVFAAIASDITQLKLTN